MSLTLPDIHTARSALVHSHFNTITHEVGRDSNLSPSALQKLIVISNNIFSEYKLVSQFAEDDCKEVLASELSRHPVP